MFNIKNLFQVFIFGYLLVMNAIEMYVFFKKYGSVICYGIFRKKKPV